MKSHVSTEQHKCLVCARDFDTGSILLDRRLRERFERSTLTGWGLCPEHEKLYQEGYIALVGADDAKSTHQPNGTVNPEDAWRTGLIMHMKFEAFDRIVSIPRGKNSFMFCDPAVIEKIKAMAEEGEK
jgi:hypothetical protein